MAIIIDNVRKARYAIILSTEVRSHLAHIDVRHHSLIKRTIHEQLSFEPGVRTRNRKPLARLSAFQDAWEIRFGNENCFRVFYRIKAEEMRVDVIAVAVKRGNKLFLGGEEILL